MHLHALLGLNIVPNIFWKDQSKHLRWAGIENWSWVRLLLGRFEKAVAKIHQGPLSVNLDFLPFSFGRFTQNHSIDVEWDSTAKYPKRLV